MTGGREGAEVVRIAMWSGPRNISTAMMRAFENRGDTTVIDEPFYAAYLSATGIDHPMRDEVLRTQPLDWGEVVQALMQPPPDHTAIVYQKHMTHHMVDGFGLDWVADCRNAFLIRDPASVLASYARKRRNVDLDDIGIVRQRDLFERECDRLGHAPPVIDGNDVLANPRATLTNLCAALEIPFCEGMLAWPAGRRPNDGIWGRVWYDAVERSTGFGPPQRTVQPGELPIDLQRLAEAAAPHYTALAAHRLQHLDPS